MLNNLGYIIDQARGQDGWLLAKFSFCVFVDLDFVAVHKDAERELGQCPAILTKLAWSIKDLLYDIPCLNVALCFYICVCRFLLQNVFLKLINIFVFFVFILIDAFVFLVVLYFHGKNSAKEIFPAPKRFSTKFYCRNKTGNPKLAVSLHLARSGKCTCE